LDDYFALVKAFDLLMKVIQETPNKARTITLVIMKQSMQSIHFRYQFEQLFDYIFGIFIGIVTY